MNGLLRKEEFVNRYMIKIVGSIVMAVINAIVQMALPRILSVEQYGIYSFNLSIFTTIVSFALLVTDSALISKFAKRNDDRGLYVFFFKIFLIISFILNGIMLFMCFVHLSEKAFKGQMLYVILLALNAAIMNQLVTVVVGLYDAISVPRLPTIAMIFQKTALLILVFTVYALGLFDLEFYYIIQITITGITGVVLLWFFISEHKKRYPSSSNKKSREYRKEFYIYCRPLVLARIVTQLIIIARNWILITQSGEKEQAMYGVGVQLNTIISCIFSPYATLMQREFAIVHDQPTQIKRRLEQSISQILWISGYFSIFIFICAEWIIELLFGVDYLPAVAVVRAMMIYTLYQSLGQVYGSYFMATEQTKASALFSYLFQPIEILLVILFQIPNFIFPKNLGAFGVGLTYAIGNFVMICLYGFHVKKKDGISKRWMAKIQIETIGVLSISSLIGYLLGKECLFFTSGTLGCLFKILLAGIVYTIIVVATIYVKPGLVGLSRGWLNNKLKRRKHNGI